MLVSGTASHRASLPGIVVAAVFQRKIQLLVSPQLVAEYRRILSRPKQVARLGFETARIEGYVTEFVSQAVTDEPRRAAQDCPDPTDQMLWDLLAARSDAILVTGEHLLQQSDHFPGRVRSPREFVEGYLADS